MSKRAKAYLKSIPLTDVELADPSPSEPPKFIEIKPRRELSLAGQECTFYPDGRVRLSPKVAKEFREEYGWVCCQFQVPIEKYPRPDDPTRRDPNAPPATHLLIRGSEQLGNGNRIEYRDDGFAEFREVSMYPVLKAVWPTNQWTGSCEIIGKDCSYPQYANWLGVVVPVHPSVKLRTSQTRQRGPKRSPEFTRARRPEVGDLYGNSECTRLILAILAALRDEDARITYLETDLEAPHDYPQRRYEQTISLAGFRNWISMGARLIEVSPL